MYDAAKLQEIGLDAATLHPVVLCRPPPLPVAENKIKAMPPAGVVPEPQFYEVDPEAGIEEKEELHDALSPVYDQLALVKYWWFLEILPLRGKYQKNVDGSWASAYSANWGGPRYIPGQQRTGVRVHRSVCGFYFYYILLC